MVFAFDARGGQAFLDRGGRRAGFVQAPAQNGGADPGRFPAVSRAVLAELDAAVAAGVRVLADFNDDHFDRPDVGTYWRALARCVGLCAAGSETMAVRLRCLTPAPVFVVG
ncbi:MAG TPA: hypothetical protein PKZ00_06570, partial [Elusimicrobiota bacterium]|nr:hypothetical protein [Elusimicrobiota bacterium]